MSLAKFISLISSRVLHFTQVQRFREEDPYEATYSRPNRSRYELLERDDGELRRYFSISATEEIQPILRKAMSVEFNKRRMS